MTEYIPHHTWGELEPLTRIDVTNVPIPVYHPEEWPGASTVYESFYKESGCFIVKSAYKSELMDQFNTWCSSVLREAAEDPNSRHPIQHGKLLINNLLSRLSRDDPDLFMEIYTNSTLTTIMDILLGFGCFGSATAHWIEPGGERQAPHVDYPVHLASAPFWGKNLNKFKRLVTRYHTNSVLPYHSVQILVASDSMDIRNGSTEVVPGSHLIPDIDVHIQDDGVKRLFEPQFRSVTLDKGDILVFNRRLVHRGGYNASNSRRNSLILQCVHLWSIPQELHPYEEIECRIKESSLYKQMSQVEREELLLRVHQPYPRNVTKST